MDYSSRELIKKAIASAGLGTGGGQDERTRAFLVAAHNDHLFVMWKGTYFDLQRE